jgi:hypothetical protein
MYVHSINQHNINLHNLRQTLLIASSLRVVRADLSEGVR